MKGKDEIEALFSSTFEDFSVEPPADLKKSLDNKLFNKKAKVGYWIFGSIILLGLIVSLTLLNQETTSSIKNTSSSTYTSVNSSSEIKTNPLSQKNNQSINNDREVKKQINVEKQNVSVQAINNKEQVEQLKKADFNSKNINTKKSIANKVIKNRKSRKFKSRKVTTQHSILTKSDDGLLSSNKQDNFDSKDDVVDYTISNKLPKEEIVQSNSINYTDLAKTNEIEQKTKTDSVIIQKGIEDTIVNEQTAVVIDSNLNQLVKDPISKWLISARFGTGVGFNSFKNQNNYDLNEKKTFFLNVELTKMLNSNYSFTSGIQYDQNESLLSYKYDKIENLFLGFDTTYVPILDPNGATIGYNTNLNPKYGNTTLTNALQNRYSVIDISLPIYLGFSTKLNKQFYLDVNSGFLMGYQKGKLLSGTANINDPKFNHFGLKVCLRPQIRYEFKNVGISINTSIGYDILPAMNWSGVKRNRFYSNFGLGFHYSF